MIHVLLMQHYDVMQLPLGNSFPSVPTLHQVPCDEFYALLETLCMDRGAQLKDIVCVGAQGTAICVPPCGDDHAASGHILHIQNGPVTDEV